MSKRRIFVLITLLLASLRQQATQAATNVFNFDSDPSEILTVSRGGDNATLTAMAGAWFATGGSTLEANVSDQSTNGYFAITQISPAEATHGMKSVIVFDDFDNGAVVAGFTFTCDVRIGAGSTTPADGFSLNFARANDPVVLNPATGAFSSGPNNTPPNTPEEGTTTGLAISFDAFANSTVDPIGLTIKVDNVVVTNIAMATLNGACAAINSLQTGPATGGLAGLCWQPLYASLTVDGYLNIAYKGVTLVTNFQTSFVPGPGRLVFAGRTGGSYQEQDVDNIRIVTVAPESPVTGPSTGNAFGFRLNIVDQGVLFPDTNTLSLTLDGAPITATRVTRTQDAGTGANYTVLGYQNTGTLLAPGSTHTNVVSFTGAGFTGTVSKTNVFTVATYITLTAAQKAPSAVDTSITGLAGHVNLMAVARGLDLNAVEAQLAGALIDPNTGEPYENLVAPGDFTLDYVNWADASVAGSFNFNAPAPQNIADTLIPGFDVGDVNNVAAEAIGILDLPVGAYQLGVSHDDTFKLSAGAEPRDALDATVLASSAIARDDANINIVVTDAGKYPVRLAWGEATGLAQLEFYATDFATGQRYLINQPGEAAAIVSYGDLAALTKPYVKFASPAPNQTGILNTAPLVVKLVNGATVSVQTNTISLKVNGVGSPTITQTDGETTITLTNNIATAQASVALSYQLSSGETVSKTWTYRVSFVGQVLFSIPLNEGAGTNFADTAQGLKGYFLTNAPFWTNGVSGLTGDFAMYFDGTGGRRGTIPDTNRVITLGPDFTGANGDYTLQAWVKLPDGFNPTVRMVLFAYEGIPGYSLSINTGRTLHTTTFGLNDLNSTVVVPNDNQWHHVAVVHKNGTSMNFYLDGVLGQELAYIRGPGQRANLAITVGAASNGANPFTGTIDRISFVKGALSAAQLDFPLPIGLRVTQNTAGTVTIAWPASAVGYTLQSTSSLTPPVTWSDVSTTPTNDGSNLSVTVTADGQAKFYRLIKAQ